MNMKQEHVRYLQQSHSRFLFLRLFLLFNSICAQQAQIHTNSHQYQSNRK